MPALPFDPPLKPMLAKAAASVPTGDTWLYEPKFDGFRTLVFRNGADVYLQSRDSKPMLRYFPELLEPLLAGLPDRCVLDGELVIVTPRALDFDALQMRIHPARSRIDKLAAATPARFVAFDVLALGDEDLREAPFGERRGRLERILAGSERPLHIAPATREVGVAEDWFVRFEGAGFDGVMAKGLADPYQPGKRTMRKVKHRRTCECAVAGFRWHKEGPPLVGSLILGLYDEHGTFQQVGVAASFTKKRRAELAEELAPHREDALDGHPWASWAEATAGGRRPGVKSRWSGGRELVWEPLRMGRVAEVAYNHFSGGRFRHPVQFKRWRHDKAPADCTFSQMETVPPVELDTVFR